MTGNAPSLFGFRPTLRHQMIVVAYFALLSAAAAPQFQRTVPDPAYAVVRLILLGSPWVLGGLVAVFDRPGPLRDWAAAGFLFAFYPSLTLFLDLSAARDAATTGACPRLGGLLLFNALMLASTLVYLVKMRPQRCPSCARRSLIPLVRLMGQSRRFRRTRWCASCGGQFWHNGDGAWRAERRTTWVALPLPLAEPVRG